MSLKELLLDCGASLTVLHRHLARYPEQRGANWSWDGVKAAWLIPAAMMGQWSETSDWQKQGLTQLMDTTGLLCHLGIIDNGSAYYILKVESSATISVRSHEGKSLSLYRSGIGKCLLAWQPAAVQQSIIEGLVWEQATPTTITHPQQLHEELARIRRQGWSYDNGEDYPDVRCVAAPVFNANNELTAAISVVGTRLQINEEYRDYLAGKAIACARDISRLLGWKSPFDLQAS